MEKSIIQKMIEAEIISEKDIVEYYNNNLKAQVENLPKKSEKPTYSIIEDGVLVKFDERDLNSKGGYTTPKGVFTIGCGAFERCEKLRKIHISGDVIKIECGAFALCENLQTVIMTNSVREIGSYAFNECYSLKSINLSNNIEEIPDCIFTACKNLQTITLPNKIKRIRKFAFAHCENIVLNNFPTTLSYIHPDAFKETKIKADVMRLYFKNLEEQKQENVK